MNICDYCTAPEPEYSHKKYGEVHCCKECFETNKDVQKDEFVRDWVA